MVITVKKKCRVDEGVMDVYREKGTDALKVLFDKMNTAGNSRRAATLLSQRRGDVARLNEIIKGVSRPGRGIDREMARLRGTDFESIELKMVRTDKWLVAQTRDLRMVAVQSNNYYNAKKGDKYDYGDYKIYVKVSDLGTPKLGSLHFVPDLEPFVHERHHHHKADMTRNARERNHPVFMTPRSCWGGFSEPISANMSYCDLPELFRILRVFVGRYNPGSPLAHPEFGRGKVND